ncbi:MAG: TonB-dependent receptor plug domain-containing protein, partial [Phocaeicola sp.]|nr:TonB-dependent receptor plug domain-containing protein [Phocaeicola sp.]
MATQEVEIKANVQVTLKSDTEILDEVMVVAFGTAKKSAFTGSATVVKAETIEKVQTSNAVTALTGKVSGVQMVNSSGQPGQAKPEIRVRGISSITAGKEPLIILDGTPYDGDMNNINSQDIESMTVLKDAASNALYGARGANGVIMITTKNGQKGGASRVTLDAKWGSNSRATQRYKTINDPARYYETHYQALKNYALANELGEQDAHAWANNNLINGTPGLGYNVYAIPSGQDMIGIDGKLNPSATMGNVLNYNGKDYLLQADDWLDEAYRTSLRQEYNVSISNASDKNSFYTSFGYLKNEGIIQNSGYERLTGRLKADSQVKSWLKVGANMSYTH